MLFSDDLEQILEIEPQDNWTISLPWKSGISDILYRFVVSASFYVASYLKEILFVLFIEIVFNYKKNYKKLKMNLEWIQNKKKKLKNSSK